MSESRLRASDEKVERAVEEIRAYYEQGRTSLRELPERGRYGAKAIAEAAEQLGCSETKLRKTRQFALMFTPKQLNALCALVREHRPHFGTTHVGIAVTVPDARVRKEMIRSCILNDWSKFDLEEKIKARLGPRRSGGRRRRVAEDPIQALMQLDKMADTWLRWHAVASEEHENNGHDESVLDRLPEAVRAEVRKVTRAVRRLREAVTDELERSRGGG